MPETEYKQPEALGPLTQAEQTNVITPEEPWSDSYAAKVALSDFQKAEAFRTQNHDWRFRNADELYLAWTGVKYWDGTKVPRSSLPIYLCYQQIESLLPSLMSSIFGVYPPFDTIPDGSTTTAEALQVEQLILHQMERVNLREEFRKVAKSGLVYGNGIGELTWESYEQQRRKFIVQRKPVNRTFAHPTMGNLQFTVGSRAVVSEKTYTDTVNMPAAKYVAIQDFYIDPNCPSPNPQEAEYTVKRVLMPIEDLLRYKEQKVFNIPDKATLYQWSKSKPATQGDYSKHNTELLRQGQWWPGNDFSTAAAAGRVEILVYTTRDRIVWLGNREAAVLNVANPYGFINYFNFCYTDVPNRFYGLAVTDIAEGEQRLQVGILNARLDELALSIHRPVIKKRGYQFSQPQLRIRPGVNWEADDPGKDIVFPEIPDVTNQAFVEVEASQRRIQQYTGVTDLAVLGTPGGTVGNSANRTATGVGAQTQASSKRIQYLVETIESTFLEPLISAWHKLNQKFLDPQQAIDILGPDGKLIQLDPMQVKNSECRFKFLASARMQSKAATLQAMPILMQTFLNPAFMQTLAQVNGKKLNVEFLGDRALDAMNIRGGDVFLPLTPDEQQKLNQPSPQDLMKLQMQRERMNTMEDMQQEKISGGIVHDAALAAQDHLLGSGEEEEPSAA